MNGIRQALLGVAEMAWDQFGPTNGNGSNGNGSSGNTFTIILIVAGVVLLIGGIAVFLLDRQMLRRSSRGSAPRPRRPARVSRNRGGDIPLWRFVCVILLCLLAGLLMLLEPWEEGKSWTTFVEVIGVSVGGAVALSGVTMFVRWLWRNPPSIPNIPRPRMPSIPRPRMPSMPRRRMPRLLLPWIRVDWREIAPWVVFISLVVAIIGLTLCLIFSPPSSDPPQAPADTTVEEVEAVDGDGEERDSSFPEFVSTMLAVVVFVLFVLGGLKWIDEMTFWISIRLCLILFGLSMLWATDLLSWANTSLGGDFSGLESALALLVVASALCFAVKVYALGGWILIAAIVIGSVVGIQALFGW